MAIHIILAQTSRITATTLPFAKTLFGSKNEAKIDGWASPNLMFFSKDFSHFETRNAKRVQFAWVCFFSEMGVDRISLWHCPDAIFQQMLDSTIGV
jgi:hypothetical protein